MQKEYSDYSIHRRQDKLEIYQQQGKFWWSSELKRWICTDAKLTKAILDNPLFEVPTYSVEKIIAKIPVELTHNIRLVEYFPVAQEGEAHKVIRKRHAMQLMTRSDIALDAFKIEFQKNLDALQVKQITVNIYEDLLAPSIQLFFAILIDVDPAKLSFPDSISQILDETLPLIKRIKINHKIRELIDAFPEEVSTDERYFRVSMVALGVDSLIGTLSESIVTVLQQYNQQQALHEMNWPDEIPVTGVPVVERTLAEALMFNGVDMPAGTRFRLYLDAAGYLQTDAPAYSQLYFGAGRHLCLGMPVGKKIWKFISETFARVDKKIKLDEVSRRDYDNVFNIYNTIKVSFYD